MENRELVGMVLTVKAFGMMTIGSALTVNRRTVSRNELER